MRSSTSHPCLYAVATIWILAPGSASADSVTISVNTTVLPVCRFAASPGINASGGGSPTVLATGGITYRCTSGVAPAFTITAGCAGCADALGVVPVTLSDSGGVGKGMGSGRQLTLIVTGPIAPAPIQTASAAIDSGNVSITVSP